jgi:hypothetical protein
MLIDMHHFAIKVQEKRVARTGIIWGIYAADNNVSTWNMLDRVLQDTAIERLM